MKRVKAKPKCPNPLFVAWLEEWKEDAKSKNSEMQYCFGKALNSLRKFPLPLKSGRECIIIENFGPKLCAMLDKKLTDYKAENINHAAQLDRAFAFQFNEQDSNNTENNNTAVNLPAVVKRAKTNDGKEEPPKKTKTNNARNEWKANNAGSYIPAWRSGGYAILLTLYEKSQDPDYIGYMSKADLQSEAQKHCDSSLKKPDPGSRYCAWSSMSTLIEKGLVISKSKPAKYSLTDAGLAVAMQLSEVDENNIHLLGPSSSQNTSKSKSNETSGSAKGKRVDTVDPISKSSGSRSWDKKKNPESLRSDPPIATCSYEEFIFGEIVPPNNINRKNVLAEKKTDPPKNNDNNHLERIDIIQRTNSQRSTSSGDEPNVVLTPQSFDVILLVDDRETAGGKTRPKDDMTISELTQSKVKFEIRNLKIGDFAWIARCRDSGEELILPHIVERKRMDDFGGSIKDGRYHEQKFRLKKSGIQNVTYLIEHHGNNQFVGMPIETLRQAATNTLVQDGFNVKYTKSHRESMFYLASVTEMLTKIYRVKTLVGCKKEDLTPASSAQDLIQLMVFKDFHKATAKVKNFRAKEMFIRHLIQLKGMSVEKALAIVDFYPTPKALKKAFEEAGVAGENLLASLLWGQTKRQLGPALSKTLHQFYTRRDF